MACEARPDLQSKSQEYVLILGSLLLQLCFLSINFEGLNVIERHRECVINKA